MKIWRVILLMLVALGVFVYSRFRREMAEHRQRIEAGSQIAQTDCGTIEYGEIGSGLPVLVIHGSGGGFDQGLLLGQFIGNGFRIIAPSRFGYLNTPYPANPSVVNQADHYRCLLDYLGIDQIHVVAFSAGGTSALQFAQRHPDRVQSLVMVSAISNVRPVREANETLQTALLTDFVYWSAVTVAPGYVLDFFGLSLDAQSRLSDHEVERAEMALEQMNPLQLRTAGLEHDSTEANLFDGAVFDLESITAPTLVVHATDDTFIPLKHGEFTAEHIPDARLVTFDEGGHFVIARDDVLSLITAFLQEQSI